MLGSNVDTLVIFGFIACKWQIESLSERQPWYCQSSLSNCASISVLSICFLSGEHPFEW